MPRYIDAEQFRGKHEVAEVNGKLNSVILYADIVSAPTADVVPRSEVALSLIEYLENEGLLNMTPQGIAELKKKYTEGEK